MLQRFVILFILCAALAGCASNPQFKTELRSGKITGEGVCELPQHWKALALEGVDTDKLSRATVVQIKAPPEWLGDTLGWFVAAEDDRSLEHYPRQTWQAMVVDDVTGEKKFFPAVMKNPLASPFITVILPPQTAKNGEVKNVYVLSGARTKLLTVSGDLLPLRLGKDCLAVVDAEFLRSYPSTAQAVELDERGEFGGRFFASLRGDYPKRALQPDGTIFSINPAVLNRRAVGDLRQVTWGERAKERGFQLPIPYTAVGTIGLGISVGIASYRASKEIYVGPYGEREYTAEEARAALKKPLREYSRLLRDLQGHVGVRQDQEDVSMQMEFEGRKTGWEIGWDMTSRVKEMRKAIERLEDQLPRKKGTK